ncbi:MAG TPA: hypothetical protein VJ851_04810 [Jatrophihabitans sp.]|nr:hypothetical protein [Jatrophihabitans sp.]
MHAGAGHRQLARQFADVGGQRLELVAGRRPGPLGLVLASLSIATARYPAAASGRSNGRKSSLLPVKPGTSSTTPATPSARLSSAAVRPELSWNRTGRARPVITGTS